MCSKCLIKDNLQNYTGDHGKLQKNVEHWGGNPSLSAYITGPIVISQHPSHTHIQWSMICH